MRPALAMLAALALSSAAPVAVEAATITQSFINISMGGGGVRLLLPAAGADGGFRDAGSAVLCDGSVRVGTQCGANEVIEGLVSFSVEGSIFPFIDGTVTFIDYGAPTSLGVTFSALIPAISGLADTELSGSFTAPQSRKSPPATVTGLFGTPFVSGGVFGDSQETALFVADSSLALSDSGPTTKTWDPTTGVFDCATVGVCAGVFVFMGFDGLGDGGAYQISGRFDIDPVAPIPLPAPVALLAAGLGLLGLTARRRRG